MRWFLDQDSDAHWYLVPAERRMDWDGRDLPEEDEYSWEVPSWAIRIGGAPSQVTFTDPAGGV